MKQGDREGWTTAAIIFLESKLVCEQIEKESDLVAEVTPSNRALSEKLIVVVCVKKYCGTLRFPFWEADSRSLSQEIVWNPDVHYLTRNIPELIRPHSVQAVAS